MERWGKLPLLRGLFFMGAFASDVHSAPFAKPRFQRFPLLAQLLFAHFVALPSHIHADFHASMKSANKNV